MRVMLGYEAALYPTSGIPRYVRRLATDLPRTAGVDELALLLGYRFLPLEAAAQGGGVASQPSALVAIRRRLGRLGARSGLFRDASAYVRRRPVEAAFAARGFDLVHEPNYVTRRLRVPTIVTMHDMSIYDNPSMHPADRVGHFRREIPRSIERAARIVTLSDFSRDRILARFPQAEGRIDVVPVGLEESFAPRTESEAGATLAAHGLCWRSYLLFVGTMEPRKNLIGVLQAMALRPDADWRACPLVVVGGGGWRNEALNADLETAQARGVARRLGAVSDAALADLYAGARGVVFPSHYEGQGLPALEAAACGTPVLTSLASPMASYLGDLPVLVNPAAPGSIASGLDQLMTEEGLAPRAQEAARILRGRFSWERCLADTVACYRRALSHDGCGTGGDAGSAA